MKITRVFFFEEMVPPEAIPVSAWHSRAGHSHDQDDSSSLTVRSRFTPTNFISIMLKLAQDDSVALDHEGQFASEVPTSSSDQVVRCWFSSQLDFEYIFLIL